MRKHFNFFFFCVPFFCLFIHLCCSSSKLRCEDKYWSALKRLDSFALDLKVLVLPRIRTVFLGPIIQAAIHYELSLFASTHRQARQPQDHNRHLCFNFFDWHKTAAFSNPHKNFQTNLK